MGCWLLLAVPQAEIPNDHGGNAVAALIVGKDVEPLTDATFLQSFANWPGPCGTDPLTPGNHPIWAAFCRTAFAVRPHSSAMSPVVAALSHHRMPTF